MENGRFAAYAAVPGNPGWETYSARCHPLCSKENDTRDVFERDYTRILHCLAYRRLKHKTQVFYNIGNDHICTRMEHVSHVESVATVIARSLGLNTSLTRSIAMGHDLGHAPFGHQGERLLDKLSKQYLGTSFFHEKNGLRFVDKIELLEDDYRIWRNLNLTFAVRDGILSHCGELDQNGIRPRTETIDLYDFTECGQYQPVTWEGCVVKVSDKIAYLGRDIEDACRLHFLTDGDMCELRDIARIYGKKAINTTAVIHDMIYDICENSSPEKGIRLSDESAGLLNEIKNFNMRRIYRNRKLSPFGRYADLVLTELSDFLMSSYVPYDPVGALRDKAGEYPALCGAFAEWLTKYCERTPSLFDGNDGLSVRYQNEKIYGTIDTEKDYMQAVIDFISGMTDTYAIRCHNELITY